MEDFLNMRKLYRKFGGTIVERVASEMSSGTRETSIPIRYADFAHDPLTTIDFDRVELSIEDIRQYQILMAKLDCSFSSGNATPKRDCERLDISQPLASVEVEKLWRIRDQLLNLFFLPVYDLLKGADAAPSKSLERW